MPELRDVIGKAKVLLCAADSIRDCAEVWRCRLQEAAQVLEADPHDAASLDVLRGDLPGTLECIEDVMADIGRVMPDVVLQIGTVARSVREVVDGAEQSEVPDAKQ